MAFGRRLCIASHVGIEKKNAFPGAKPRARPHFSIKLSVTPLTSLSSLFSSFSSSYGFFYTLSIVLCGKFENGFMLCSPSSVDNVLSFRRFLFFPPSSASNVSNVFEAYCSLWCNKEEWSYPSSLSASLLCFARAFSSRCRRLRHREMLSWAFLY